MLEKQFGERIKQLRKETKLTQEQLAEIVGTDSRTVRRWESGESGPEFNKLERIAQAFHVPVIELFTHTTNEK